MYNPPGYRRVLMPTLKISGHSDDVVCYELGKRADELYPPDRGGEGPLGGTLLVHSSKGRCLVHVLYDGCWAFAVSKVDEEDGDLFPIKLGWEGYSQQIELEVPKGTKVEWRR
jgi:hypothetical protein